MSAAVKMVPAQPAPLAKAELADSILERVLVLGDLAKLTPSERVTYYKAVCQSVGLNPLTKPYAYIALNGQLQLYAQKNCTDQLRQIHGISVDRVVRSIEDGLFVATVDVSNAAGRKDSDIGAVAGADSLKGEQRANASMKAVTKGKRRATLGICGLSMLDESELDTVKGARRVEVDYETGEIVGEQQREDTAKGLFAMFIDGVNKSATLDTLKGVVGQINAKKAKLSTPQFEELKALIKSRKDELESPPPPEDIDVDLYQSEHS